MPEPMVPYSKAMEGKAEEAKESIEPQTTKETARKKRDSKTDKLSKLALPSPSVREGCETTCGQGSEGYGEGTISHRSYQIPISASGCEEVAVK